MKILLVDDHCDIRDIYETFLVSFFNCKVSQADSAKSAQDILKKNGPFDIIISDYHMPEGNGGELYQYVKKYHPQTPFILFSSDVGIIDQDQAFIDFFNHHANNSIISKPCSGMEFTHVVKNVYDHLLYPPSTIKQGRKYPRFNIVTDAYIHLEAQKRDEYTKVINISDGGMFIRLDDHFPANDSLISFKLISGHRKHESGKGLVKWVRMENNDKFLTGCGIEFVS